VSADACVGLDLVSAIVGAFPAAVSTMAWRKICTEEVRNTPAMRQQVRYAGALFDEEGDRGERVPLCDCEDRSAPQRI
jgi:hypothetical protein